MATTSDDSARLLVSIEATQAKFEKQLAAIAKRAADTARGIEGDFKKANDRAGSSFDKGSREAEKGLARGRAAAANLSFQLNDIATSLLSGASPFRVMAQQGGQVAQVFQQMGGGIKGAMSTLGGAITGLLNPVGLLSVALIGVTGYAVQYFAEWASSGAATSEEIEKQAKLIQQVADRWGDAVPALRAYADELKRAADQADRLAAYNAAVARQYDRPRAALDTAFPDYLDALARLEGSGEDVTALQRDFANLEAEIKAGTATAQDATAIYDRLITLYERTGIEAVRKLADQFKTLAPALDLSADRAAKLRKEQETVNLSLDEGKRFAALLASQMVGLGPVGIKAFQDIAAAAMNGLVPAIESASGKVKELFTNYQKLQGMVAQTPLGTLSPLVSGGGQFLSPEEFQNFKFNQAQFQQAGDSMAAAAIRKFESFRSNAYWDVNAWRTGFGSDTTTRANGSIEKVTQQTVVTLADAERDLSRRIIEFQSGIQNAIGIGTWNSLAEGQKAALTSIAYNYGQLPKSIVAAIKNGGGPEAVAQAIAGLSANKSRRREEAQLYLQGTGVSMGEAGLSGTVRKTPSDLFKGDMEQIRARIALMTAENNAQASLTAGVNDYGFAVEQAKIKQQLLNEAKARGVEITPQLEKEIDGLATSYARASASSEELAAKQKLAVETQRQWGQIAQSAFQGITSALQDGKITAEEWLNIGLQIIQQMMQMKSIAGGLGGGFGGGFLGLLGGLFGGGFAQGGYTGPGGVKQPAGVVHAGEVVWSQADIRRAGGVAVVEAMRRGLRGYDFGGVVARAPVIPRRQAGDYSATSPYGFTIHINAPGADAAGLAQVKQAVKDLQKSIPKMVDQRNSVRQNRKVRA